MSKDFYSSLYFFTREEEKLKEFRSLLNIEDLNSKSLNVPDFQIFNLHKLVVEKIELIRTQMPSIPFFIEHTGLKINAWKGLPGGLTRGFMEALGNDLFCKLMEPFKKEDERSALAQSVIGFCHPDGTIETFEGKVEGKIAEKPRGTNNFGWDPIFIPIREDKSDERTYGEITPEEKYLRSMRSLACDEFKKYLSQRYQLF